jgi:hypothetical protein
MPQDQMCCALHTRIRYMEEPSALLAKSWTRFRWSRVSSMTFVVPGVQGMKNRFADI